MFYKLTSLILVLLVAFLLLQKACTKEKDCPTYTEPSKEDKRKSLEREKYLQERVYRLAQDSAYQQSVIEDISAKWMADRKLLTSANITATELINELDNAVSKKDTVSYYENCDSLRNLARHVSGVFTDYSKSTDELLVGMNQQRAICEEQKDLWKTKSDSLESKLKEKPVFRPRNVLLVGGGISGNKTAFGAVEVGLMLKDKKNRIYGLSAGMGFNGQTTYAARYYVPIRKR